MRLLRGVERVVVVDALAQADLVAIKEIRDYCAGQRGLRHLRTGRALLDRCDAGAESPMETRTRMVLVDGGLPLPETQIEVFHPRTGQFVGRLDMGYRELMVAIEYDGALHWEQRRADDRRRDALRAIGWIVIVVSAEDIYQRPRPAGRAVAAAMRAAARRRTVPLPARRTPHPAECDAPSLTDPLVGHERCTRRRSSGISGRREV